MPYSARERWSLTILNVSLRQNTFALVNAEFQLTNPQSPPQPMNDQG